MKKLIISIIVIVIVIVGIVLLKYIPGVSAFIWNMSNGGLWLLPLVLVSSLLDSVHPCSFSILLITIAFLFGMQMTRDKILKIGGIYIAGIFSAYFLIGLGILKVLHLFSVPHFMGKLGATLLIVFGIINLINYFFPKFPIKLKLPSSAHTRMALLMEKSSMPAAFGLGLLVGICQFPCMGGPYLMVIGLLHDQVTYFSGFGYLVLYNLILIIPLVAVLWISADKIIVSRMGEWKKNNVRSVHFWAGLIMILIGILVLLI